MLKTGSNAEIWLGSLGSNKPHFDQCRTDAIFRMHVVALLLFESILMVGSVLGGSRAPRTDEFMFVLGRDVAAVLENILHREALYFHALAQGCSLIIGAAPFATDRLSGVVEEYALGKPARKSPGRRARGLYELAAGSDGSGYQYCAGPDQVLHSNIGPIIAKYFSATPQRLYMSPSMRSR